MTFRREFFRCVMALTCLMVWGAELRAQGSKPRTKSIEEIEAEFEQSARPSPFYDEVEPQPSSTTVRRESAVEVEATEPERPARAKTPLPTSDFADEGESASSSRSSFGRVYSGRSASWLWVGSHGNTSKAAVGCPVAPAARWNCFRVRPSDLSSNWR